MGRIKNKKFYKKMKAQIDEEKFRPIYLDGQKSIYYISSKGRVLSTNFRNSGNVGFLRQFVNKDGHYSLTLKFNNKNYYRRVHRLMAEAFIPNPDKKEEVHHIDGNPMNNSLDNLLWVTPDEHKSLTSKLDQYDRPYGEKSSQSIYSNMQIEEVCKLLEENKLTMKEISKITGVKYYSIQLLLYRKSYHYDVKSKYNISGYSCSASRKYTDEQIEKVCELLTDGVRVNEIAKITGVGRTLVSQIKKGTRHRDAMLKYLAKRFND